VKVVGSLLQLVGLGAVTVALWMIAVPLAVGFAGVAAVMVGAIVERG